MEDLIELVAASLKRHGIECPGADNPGQAWRRSTPPTLQTAAQSAPEPTALPEHSYRKTAAGDPAP